MRSLTYIVCGKNKRLIQIFLDEAQKRKSAKAAHMDVKLTLMDAIGSYGRKVDTYGRNWLIWT